MLHIAYYMLLAFPLPTLITRDPLRGAPLRVQSIPHEYECIPYRVQYAFMQVRLRVPVRYEYPSDEKPDVLYSTVHVQYTM